MQFLSDVFIRCPECNGRRYRPHILEIQLSSKFNVQSSKSTHSTLHDQLSTVSWSIADLLEASVDEVLEFLGGLGESRHGKRAFAKVKLLQDVGLGYLRLGQPINTLSGGESQRLKLVSHLAEFQNGEAILKNEKPSLFFFDEPTTGLHFDDVRVLLNVFQKLVDAGHSVVVIEHNLDLIKCADWLVDLGPEAGSEGGKIVAAGMPEEIAKCRESHTGAALKTVL